MTPYQTLRSEKADGLLTLTLSRPAALNAFTVRMSQELVHAFGQASRDPEVRAILLTGEGRAFCAGMDLSADGNVFGLDERLHPTPQDMRDALEQAPLQEGVRDTGGKVTLAMFECDKPIIAAINGAAIGIGATMTLAADVRIASAAARFGFVFTRLGIVPEACSSWFLPRLVGIAQALEWTLAGEVFDAQEALRGGLVRKVVEPATLLERARAVAARFIHGTSPTSVALTRRMMWRNAALEHPVEAHRIDSLAMFYTSQLDGKEGVQAFLEKRPPAYGNRSLDALPPVFPN